MTYQISYTSPTEHITIAASGETMVDALAKMVEEFGDGFTLLYEHTHNELLQLVSAIEETHQPKDVEPEPTEEEVAEREALSIFRGEDVPDPDVPVPQTSREAAREAVGGDEDLPACSICGVTITKDQAIASELDLGQPRCRECST